jgi:hypothetical protein
MTEDRPRDALDDVADFASNHLREYGATRIVNRLALLTLFGVTLGLPGLAGAAVGLVAADWLAKKFVARRFNI